MKRLERANLRASQRAAAEKTPVDDKEDRRPLPPPPEEGPDHERLACLAREARERGDMFFYFPESGGQLKQDAARIDRVCKEEELRDPRVKKRNDEQPEQGMYDFFERLEEMQQELRRQKIADGEIEDPWSRQAPNAPVSSAGKKHDVVVDNGSDEEEGPQCAEAPAASGPPKLERAAPGRGPNAKIDGLRPAAAP
eukprot:CAMPEP_0197894862 /NCGR_PEP_ID=MMETSP1439-20131203/36056_1 /TAXON_ID=66791 /ORGANISM="Gonyaulax spinifera, Strain CCMP409" /LENGTH=195 /DNA_ID=CAMNT_0043515249 /DNA_START=198 /DNA_END=785 /DNA_ORIENTATION=+